MKRNTVATPEKPHMRSLRKAIGDGIFTLCGSWVAVGVTTYLWSIASDRELPPAGDFIPGLIFVEIAIACLAGFVSFHLMEARRKKRSKWIRSLRRSVWSTALVTVASGVISELLIQLAYGCIAEFPGYILATATIGSVFAPFGYRWFGYVKPVQSYSDRRRELGDMLRTVRNDGCP